MKRFLLPTILLLAILFGAYYATHEYREFCADRAVLAQAMSRDGGDNVWDNPYFNVMLKKLSEDRYDILYLCDSVMFTNGHSDQYTLAQFLESASGKKTFAIAGPGFSPLLFKEYSRIINKISYRPVVIIGVNLRSFSHAWAAAYPYRALRTFLAFQDWQPSFFDWLRFKLESTDSKSFFEKRCFDDSFANSSFFERHDFVKDPSSKLCASYAESYTTPISADHPMLIDLMKTIRRIRSYGSEVIVYVTPLDFENITNNCGEHIGERARGEIQKINKALSSLGDRGVIVLDLSAELGPDGFAEPEYANEHLTEKGRKTVAQALAKACREHEAAYAALPTR